MSDEPKIIDPQSEFPHEYSFAGIHYFSVPWWGAKKGSYTWLVWTGEEKDFKKWGHFYDEENDHEYEKEYIDRKTVVKGMIELQQSTDDENVIWLKFFEIDPEFQGKGFSKVMINALTDIFPKMFPGKTLSRSRPSADGQLKLKNNMTEALEKACIPYKFSTSLYDICENNDVPPSKPRP